MRRQAELLRDRLGDARGAVAALQQAVEARPQELESHLMLAPLLEQLRWWQDAAQTYRQISELVPGDETSRKARIKRPRSASASWAIARPRASSSRSWSSIPTDEQAARYMAALCERMGRWDRARDLWQQLARTRDGKKRSDALLSLAFVCRTASTIARRRRARSTRR